MIRVWIVFILLLAGIVWAVVFFITKRQARNTLPSSLRFVAPVKTKEMWSQLYETSSLEDLNALRMRLGEENLSFVVFEQAKRGLDGKAPPQYGVAIAKAHLSRGQSILAKILS